MSLQATKKDKNLNIAYSVGAAVVLIGALMKITHFNIWVLTGNVMLTIGLVTEAAIFIMSAFDPPRGEYSWELVYPELESGESSIGGIISSKHTDDVEVGLSKKLDKIMEEANLDANLISNLKNGIDSFKSSIDEMGSLAGVSSSSQKYSDQMSVAANHMESLNALYSQQMEESEKLLSYNKQIFDQVKYSAEKSADFSKQMSELTKTLADMNKVYGNMLNAMKS